MLSRLGAPSILPSGQSNGGDMQKHIELAKWLSDWHLIAFLQTTGLFSEVRMQSLSMNYSGTFFFFSAFSMMSRFLCVLHPRLTC